LGSQLSLASLNLAQADPAPGIFVVLLASFSGPFLLGASLSIPLK